MICNFLKTWASMGKITTLLSLALSLKNKW